MNAGIFGVAMPDHRVQEIIDTIHAEDYPSLSPDRKWLAYQSDEQKTAEVLRAALRQRTPRRFQEVDRGFRERRRPAALKPR